MLEKDTLGGVCAATFPSFLEVIDSGLLVLTRWSSLAYLRPFQALLR
jgi:hypothetical protein